MSDPDTLKRRLPEALRALTADAQWTPVTEGMSGALVFRLQSAHSADSYLKIAPHDFHNGLLDEKLRLDWLQGKLPVPQVLHFADDGSDHYLLLSAIPGLGAHDPVFERDPESMARTLAQGLRMIHAVDIRNCPFDQRLNVEIAEARRRADTGLVDNSDFDEERQGRTAASIFQELLATRPQDEDPVFTHGDYCLPNIILDPQSWAIGGFIDWGRAGIADRYQDLALASRSLAYNGDAEWIEHFLHAYGLEKIDPQKIAFYKLLDEFF